MLTKESQQSAIWVFGRRTNELEVALGRFWEVRCFDNQPTCSGRRAEARGFIFVCPRLSVFYYEGFSSRTDGRKLVVRVRAGGNPPRCQSGQSC